MCAGFDFGDVRSSDHPEFLVGQRLNPEDLVTRVQQRRHSGSQSWFAGHTSALDRIKDQHGFIGASALVEGVSYVVRGLDGEGFCKGDSGGPTYDLNQAGQTFVIGINVRNRTSSCEDPAIGHLTHVSLFLDWIECQTEGLNSQIQAVCPT
ncbi:MAG: trypsin-like serine protease [Proteobacteria bacterium]|nr:MAG: trypsin-like serine protease [Pseudomonadota bacterium]